MDTTTTEQASRLIEALRGHANVIERARAEVIGAKSAHKRVEARAMQVARQDPQAVRELADGLESGKLTIGDLEVGVTVNVGADIMDGEKGIARVQGELNTDGSFLEECDLLGELRDPDDGALPFDWIEYAGPGWWAEDGD